MKTSFDRPYTIYVNGLARGHLFDKSKAIINARNLHTVYSKVLVKQNNQVILRLEK